LARHLVPFERLPEGYLDTVAHPPERPAWPLPAATLALLRDGDGGLEVLLLRRAAHVGFVPGAWVFPGGGVDRSDGDKPVLARLDGLEPEEAARRLGLPWSDPPAIAYWVAALREAFEETGILVARDEEGGAPRTARQDPAVDALRSHLMGHQARFHEVLDRLGCRLDGGAVEYMAHWITPEAEPKRFDARFFAARVRAGAHPVVDPRETTEALWITPAEALRRHREGGLPMVFPTFRSLEDLSAFPTVDTALAGLRGRRIVPILPRLTLTSDGIVVEVDP
jgi:8-oxo-dGTP pyrophosphatase MutT (NUDIX family)